MPCSVAGWKCLDAVTTYALVVLVNLKALLRCACVISGTIEPSRVITYHPYEYCGPWELAAWRHGLSWQRISLHWDVGLRGERIRTITFTIRYVKRQFQPDHESRGHVVWKRPVRSWHDRAKVFHTFLPNGTVQLRF